MKNSIAKPTEYEKYYQKLGLEHPYFDTLKDVLVFATVLGYYKKSRIPFTKAGGENIKENYFEDDMKILNIIAILENKDIDILLNEKKEEKYKMIEEYAHGGIKYLVDNIFTGEITSEEKIIDFVLQFDSGNERKHFDITDVIKDIVVDLEG